jgi:hypothetical protein
MQTAKEGTNKCRRSFIRLCKLVSRHEQDLLDFLAESARRSINGMDFTCGAAG